MLTPRFYTTDFDEMEQLFSQDLNPNLDMAELEVRPYTSLTPALRYSVATYWSRGPSSVRESVPLVEMTCPSGRRLPLANLVHFRLT